EVRADRPDNGSTVVLALGQTASLQGIAGLKVEPSDSRAAEGFRIRINRDAQGSWVMIIGNDARGVLYGVGHLLRQLHLTPGRITVADEPAVSTAPRYPLRGHQLGYRPKTHSYDAWDLATWEQYYRDLIVFGANAVELIPPRSDDATDSPHFP